MNTAKHLYTREATRLRAHVLRRQSCVHVFTRAGVDPMSAVTTAILRDLTADQLAELADRLRPYLESAHRDDLLTPAQAARRLGVHPKTLTRSTST